MSLPEKLEAFRKQFEAGGPPYNAPEWIHEPMHHSTQELIDSGAAGKALKVGDKAPSFILNDPDGKPVSSAGLLAKGPLIVTFYRGVWCPYCNMELQALEETLPEFQKLGATLVAVSPQLPVNSRRSQRENKLTFPILSDPKNGVADSFGLKWTLQDYLVKVYTDAFKVDLQTVNGDPSWTLPMPARFVIGQDGKLLYAEVNPDYTTRPDPSEVIPILKRSEATPAGQLMTK